MTQLFLYLFARWCF